jgi:hypothetical protein
MEAVRTSETSVDNNFTRQYIPEDNSEHHTRRRENLKSHLMFTLLIQPSAPLLRVDVVYGTSSRQLEEFLNSQATARRNSQRTRYVLENVLAIRAGLRGS